MAPATSSTQSNPARGGNARARASARGRRGGRGGHKSNNNRGDAAQSSKPDVAPDASADARATAVDVSPATKPADEEAAADEGTVCWICAEPVKYWSVSECNHRTCHVCALRLRALYKKTECTFCKVR